MIFVAIRLNDYIKQLDIFSFDGGVLISLVLFVVLYSTSYLLLSVAWKKILRHLGINIDILTALKIYGVSQLSKYVPGNIVHLISRQALGVSAGIPGRELAKSAVMEIVVLVLAGVCFIPLVLPVLYSSISPGLAIGFLIVIYLFTAILLRLCFGNLISTSFTLSFLFLFATGVIYCGVIYTNYYQVVYLLSPWQWLQIGGGFITAWLLGFVTPGAPAGIGIREVVLLFIMDEILGNDDVILAIIIMRAITVMSDIVFYLFSVSFRTDITGTSQH